MNWLISCRVPVLAAALLLVLTGCSKRVDVTGRLVENGKPVPQADLRWVHEREGNPIAMAVTDGEGKFVLVAEGKRGVPAGHYEITISYWKTRAGQALPEGEKGAVLKATDASVRYTATLIREVPSQGGTVDLDLTGKGRPIKE
ncbi:MAG: carboxypeptidase-like regulatory domain-containing protein [Gemmataceae bacterium]